MQKIRLLSSFHLIKMATLFLGFLLSNVIPLKSQCDNLIEVKVDKFYDIKYMETVKPIKIKDFEFTIFGAKDADHFSLGIDTNTPACVSQYSNVIILLESGHKKEMANFRKINCRGGVDIFLGIKDAGIVFGHITGIRVEFDDGFKDLELSLDESKKLQELLNCAKIKKPY